MTATTTAKRTPGRPATGRNKTKLTVTIGVRLEAKLRKFAKKTNRPLSAIVDELLTIATTPAKG